MIYDATGQGLRGRVVAEYALTELLVLDLSAARGPSGHRHTYRLRDPVSELPLSTPIQSFPDACSMAGYGAKPEAADLKRDLLLSADSVEEVDEGRILAKSAAIGCARLRRSAVPWSAL
jgi:hypothetical protein